VSCRKRAPGSGGHAALTDAQRFILAQTICKQRRLGANLGLEQVQQLALALAPPGSKFKASHSFIKTFFAEYGLAGPFAPHPRTQAWFPTESQLGSESGEDVAPAVITACDKILEYLADSRAKRILIELRGLGKTDLIFSDVKAAVALATAAAAARGDHAADNVVVNDESRWKAGASSTKVVDQEGTRRAYVLQNVPTSFPGFTVLLSFAGCGTKLAVMVVAASKYAVAVELPTRSTLGLSGGALPDPLLCMAHSKTGWNNSRLYKTVYREHVLRPYQEAALEARVQRGQLIVLDDGEAPRSNVGPYVHQVEQVRNRRLLETLLLHDTFRGHLTPDNVYGFHKDHVSTSVVPGGCTKFAQWLDVYFHQVLRPLVDNETARRLRMRRDLKACSAKEWRQLFVDSLLTVIFRPAVAQPLQTIAQLRSLGITSKLDGSEDQDISIRVTAAPMQVTRLQAMAVERLQVLAAVSREHELQGARERARLWQDEQLVKQEREQKKEAAAVRKEKTHQADNRRLKRRRTEGKGPAHSDTDSSESEAGAGNGGSESEEEEKGGGNDEEHLFDTLAEAIPLGYKKARKPHTIDGTMVGAFIGFRWNTGWECGQVKSLLEPTRKRGKNFVPQANFDVLFSSDAHPREAELTSARYSAAKGAPDGSWVLFCSA